MTDHAQDAARVIEDKLLERLSNGTEQQLDTIRRLSSWFIRTIQELAIDPAVKADRSVKCDTKAIVDVAKVLGEG